MDITIVISTCKHSYSAVKELIIQLEESRFPKENVLFVSGQEDANCISFEKGYKIVKVNYTGLQLTGAIYVNENIEDYRYTNYWLLLPDTIRFGKDFFNKLFFQYETYLKENMVHSLPFINPNLRATMDMGIIHTQHLINLSAYWNKIKTYNLNHNNLLILKKQLIYDENVTLGLSPQVPDKSTIFDKPENYTKPPTIFISNDYGHISENLINDNKINQIYFSQLDLYKYQKNFNGPDAPLVLATTEEPKAKSICYITAIYGNYESSCKRFAEQTAKSDFICFTDNVNINGNGWIIDTTPYHYLNKNPQDDDNYVNSLCNNTHTFNVAKYYKQSFKYIPRLKDYDVVVWLDGTLEIIYDRTSEYILNNIYKEKIIGWNHEWRYGKLGEEVKASHYEKYTDTKWLNQIQPYQDIDRQYLDYLNDGYSDQYFKDKNSHSQHFGVWITCFVAFLNKDEQIAEFLDLWYLQTLKYTTQDQVGFSYVCQKTEFTPLTLPNNEVHGESPHSNTMFYTKHMHG